MPKKILYTYVAKEDVKFLKSVAERTGRSASFCMGKILGALRQRRKILITKHAKIKTKGPKTISL